MITENWGKGGLGKKYINYKQTFRLFTEGRLPIPYKNSF